MVTEQTKSQGAGPVRAVVDLEDDGSGLDTRTLAYALGAIGGVALGALLVRTLAGRVGRAAGGRLRDAVRDRTGGDGGGDELMSLEDRVLDAFLADDVLSGEPIDVGAVAPGIVELSGVVSGRDELRLALAVAQRLDGVQTVLNRLEVEGQDRWAMDPEDVYGARESGSEWTGMRGGMGARRQARGTDPDRPDDSQHQRDVAVERADRAQFEEEGYHHRPRVGSRGGEPQNPGGFDEDDLDNQSPYGKHATQAQPPREALNSSVRVGEGLKPGTELTLEGSDLPLKPHQRERGDEHRGI
jgi:hypothetical protein